MREYLLVFCVAAGVTYLLTPVARRFAQRIGAMATPRDRDVHAIPTPRLGGLAMYGGVAAGFLVASRLPALQRVFRYSDVLAVLISGGLICLLGLVDDRWGLDALTKLAGQLVSAGVMVLLGLQLLTLTLPGVGAVSLGPESVILTVFLALLTITAINFIDGLDGLAAGVGAIAALAFFAFSYSLSSGKVTGGLAQERISAPTLIAIVLAGACLGFLPHNFNPARVFMGDSGSMLIGLMLAGAATSLTGQFNYSNLPASTTFPVLLPLLLPFTVLAVPFVDLLLAVVRRTRAGRSPFAPDKAHLHHRLLEIGHSHSRAVLIMYFWTALVAFGGVAVSISGGPLPVLAVTGLLAAVALVLSNVGRLHAARGRRGRRPESALGGARGRDGGRVRRGGRRGRVRGRARSAVGRARPARRPAVLRLRGASCTGRAGAGAARRDRHRRPAAHLHAAAGAGRGPPARRRCVGRRPRTLDRPGGDRLRPGMGRRPGGGHPAAARRRRFLGRPAPGGLRVVFWCHARRTGGPARS